MSDIHFAVVTPLGKLDGRDCIYLDDHQENRDKLTLTLEGDINGSLCEHPVPEKWIPYALHLSGVIAWEIEDLDGSDRWLWASSFDEIVASSWIDKISESNAQNLHHYCIQTYDIIFHVVCTGYDLMLSTPAAA